MKSLLKIGIYAAAGYGTYEILKRTGALEKAAAWLTDHVPQDVQAKIRDQVAQAKDQISSQYANAKGQAQEQYATLKDQAQGQYQTLKGKAQDAYGQAKDQAQKLGDTAGDRFDHAKQVVTNKLNGQNAVSNNASMQPSVAEESDSAHSADAVQSGPTITGPGRGTDDATADVNGASIHHRVGRGVVHG